LDIEILTIGVSGFFALGAILVLFGSGGDDDDDDGMGQPVFDHLFAGSPA
tara:strand:- start:42 stop:191 length:150 start_codon:yes stop_codon:yes gene_type:complete